MLILRNADQAESMRCPFLTSFDSDNVHGLLPARCLKSGRKDESTGVHDRFLGGEMRNRSRVGVFDIQFGKNGQIEMVTYCRNQHRQYGLLCMEKIKASVDGVEHERAKRLAWGIVGRGIEHSKVRCDHWV